MCAWMDGQHINLIKKVIHKKYNINGKLCNFPTRANMFVTLGKGICGEGRPVHVNAPPNPLYIDNFTLTPFHQTLTNKPFLEIYLKNPPNPFTSTLACTHPKFAPYIHHRWPT